MIKDNVNIAQREQQTLCHSEQQALCHPELVSGSRKNIINIFKTAKKALAFTLAETLIVMGIIGVVSALTIPNLNSSTADKEKIAKLQKLYSNMNDAITRATAVYGPIDEWYSGKTSDQCKQVLFERITEFMKLQKSCNPNVSSCYGATINYYTAVTADGTSLWFGAWSSCGNTEGANDNCGKLYIDIDGPRKSKNKMGKDIFRFSITKNGLDYDYTSDYLSDADALKGCLKDGYNCERWVLQNGNMDYLKVDADGKCPNGKVLDFTTNTSCK